MCGVTLFSESGELGSIKDYSLTGMFLTEISVVDVFIFTCTVGLEYLCFLEGYDNRHEIWYICVRTRAYLRGIVTLSFVSHRSLVA